MIETLQGALKNPLAGFSVFFKRNVHIYCPFSNNHIMHFVLEHLCCCFKDEKTPAQPSSWWVLWYSAGAKVINSVYAPSFIYLCSLSPLRPPTPPPPPPFVFKCTSMCFGMASRLRGNWANRCTCRSLTHHGQTVTVHVNMVDWPGGGGWDQHMVTLFLSLTQCL